METTIKCYNEQAVDSLQRALIVWLKRVLLPARLPGIEIPEVSTLQEMNTMLAERVVEWTKEWEEKGMHKGETTLLKRQLIHRFGSLPNWAEESLTQASTDQLERWAEKILDATTLEEVFEE